MSLRWSSLRDDAQLGPKVRQAETWWFGEAIDGEVLAAGDDENGVTVIDLRPDAPARLRGLGVLRFWLAAIPLMSRPMPDQLALPLRDGRQGDLFG